MVTNRAAPSNNLAHETDDKMDIIAAYRAGKTRRWHANPDLSHTIDPVDAHSGRVARIIAMLHPNPSASLLRAALIHDDGEEMVGDMKRPLKNSRPDIAQALDQIETQARQAIWGVDHILDKQESAWLRFADQLDAFIWASDHAPHSLNGDGWPETLHWLRSTADQLGVPDAWRKWEPATRESPQPFE